MGKFQKPTFKKYDTQEVANRTLDEALKLEKVIWYGSFGGSAIAVKVTAAGKLVVV